jgi:PIN domain nuclease of toxin-antitoxin system
VVDTHTLFWYLTASPRLGFQAKAALDEGARGEATIYVPAIALAELYYLNEKLGRPFDLTVEFDRLRQSSQFVFTPFAAEDVLDFAATAAVPEMHDRIIVGVARRLDATCLSADLAITASQLVPVVW